jgi:peroxiredoxin Q/BCP
MFKFQECSTSIIGVSKDSIESHQKFAEKQCLSFDLLSDQGGTMCEDYGVWAEKSMLGKKYMGVERTTFLIDKEGIIRKIWPKVSVGGHVQEVLKAARAL